jgi:hypothetical protein
LAKRRFVVDPHAGVGVVRFGMSRSEVEAAMGKTPQRARRNRLDVADYDYFKDDGFFVYYGPDDRAIAIEFFDFDQLLYPPDVTFERPYADVLAWARARDPDLLIESGNHFRSDLLGVAGGPRGDDSSDTAQSVLFYRPRYYEDSDGWMAENVARFTREMEETMARRAKEKG